MSDNKNSGEYPKDLYTATRAEFVTRIRMNQPKKNDGCRKQGASMLLLILLIILMVIL